MNINAMRSRQSRPSVARVYSYVLGGRDNYGVDKDLGDYFIEDLPGSERLAITNREAVLRAAQAMAAGGIRQVIDMGCGLPTEVKVHDVVRQVQPDARVVYVDDDPFVASHGRALLATGDGLGMLEADIREPDKIESSEVVRELIDFNEPVGILYGVTLSFVNDEEDPSAIVKYWSERLAPGSAVFISHFRSGSGREAHATAAKILEAFGRGLFRTDAQIRDCFADLELEPGELDAQGNFRPCAQWRTATDGRRDLTVWEKLIVSGMARKP